MGVTQTPARFLLRSTARIAFLTLAAFAAVPAAAGPLRSQEPDSLERLEAMRLRERPLLRAEIGIWVPELSGMHVQVAESTLVATGLELGEIIGEDSEAPRGTVIGQDPPPGERAERGQTVNVVLSRGQELTIDGLEPREARQGERLEVRVIGTGFREGGELWLGPGIELGPLELISPRELVLPIGVAEDAEPGPRDVVIAYPQPLTHLVRAELLRATRRGGFTVLARPAIRGLDPPEAVQGERLEVRIIGTGFQEGSEVSLGPGIRIGQPELVSARELIVPIRVAEDAEPGTRDVLITFPPSPERRVRASMLRAVLQGGFTVFAAPEPAEPDPGRPPPRDPEVDEPEPREPAVEEPPTREADMTRPPRIGVRDPGPDLPRWLLPVAAVVGAGFLLMLGRVLMRSRARARMREEEMLTHEREVVRKSERYRSEAYPRSADDIPWETEVPPESAGGGAGGERAAPPDRGWGRGVGAGEAATAGGAGAVPSAEEEVRFTVYHPHEVPLDLWTSMLVYVHVPSAVTEIEEDSQARLARTPLDFGKKGGAATQTIARGTELVLVPEMEGFRFNPPQARVAWLEDWHCADFRLVAESGNSGVLPGTAANGRVAIYVGPVLIGEVRFYVGIAQPESDATAGPAAPAEPARSSSAPYQSVFASYSHQDSDIVSGLKKAYEALGHKMLQDIDDLRSGQRWNETLLGMIDEADIFQLYWSAAASQSVYVEQEWRHALTRGLDGFIRPVYWTRPLVTPPPELAALHFAFLPE